jgi:hypothetical protein
MFIVHQVEKRPGRLDRCVLSRSQKPLKREMDQSMKGKDAHQGRSKMSGE